MAEAARRMSSGLGTDVARRLIARPIHRQAARTVQLPATSETTQVSEAEPVAGLDLAGLTDRLQTEITLMKAVVAAERRENSHLRACIGFEDDTMGPEARAVRDRWVGVVERLLQAGL